ncbi:Uu.00g061160.m01.CDS01 [Anthostomella pinea]|uniref:Uu.00g061160.m01.CDS01 n=1 Tax=Anthostomella pinea TaxID=933095 RepID=A0AAI8YK43_9PEZI|nr:Uu.00g061160.m01.CDS01 [Anthostomella pinea]
MKLLSIFCVFVGLGAAAPSSQQDKVSYDGYRVYRVTTVNEVAGDVADFQLRMAGLSAIELNHRHISDEETTIDIAIPPGQVDDFDAHPFSATILSEDLGVDIAAEGALGNYQRLNESDQKVPSPSWFDSYHAYEDHVQFWSDLQTSFPDNSELIEAGVSFEGQPIQGIHLWGSGGRDSKPAVFFNGNVHAREWITSMVAEYLIYQIVIGYENDATVQSALDNYDFYVLPVVNPDGFVYTQTTDRLWRKNRQTRDNTTEVGTDINRNWSVGFGGEGSSLDPGSETFSGYQPGDAPETAALMAYALKLADNNGVKLYIDWHSYAQTILLSYGYTCTEFPDNIQDQIRLAAGTAQAIAQSYNTTFVYGPGCLVLYQSSGNGRDFVTDVVDAELGWGIELRDTSYGFMLPANQILPSSVEIWDGMKYLWANM